jgi:CRISPR associated protein, Cas1 family
VPDHWRVFTVRASPINRSGHAPRNAADPVNALLNYGYALGEAEARLAALAVRLDPTLGIIHTDQKARDSPAKIDLRTPLSRANTTRAQTRGRRSAHRQTTPTAAARKTCQRCGADLYGSARKLCPTCWPVMRNSYLQQVNATRTKKHEVVKPTPEDLSGGWTLQHYQEHILPGLADTSLLDIEKATGLSNPTCSRLSGACRSPTRNIGMRSQHWPA